MQKNLNMGKKFSILLLVTATCMMVQTGCDSTGATFRPNDELFEYTCYAKGSYWVYEDSATHGIDSIAVITEPQKSISDDHRHGSSSSVKTFCYQYNYTNCENSVNDTILFETTVHGDLLGSGRVGDRPEDCYLYPIRPHGKYTRSAFALTYINLQEPVNDCNNILYFEDFYVPRYDKKYQSLIIANNKYNDVKKIIIKDRQKMLEENFLFDSIISYWAKNIGVIRWECHDTTGSTIMNLVRYDVKNIKKKDLYKR